MSGHVDAQIAIVFRGKVKASGVGGRRQILVVAKAEMVSACTNTGVRSYMVKSSMRCFYICIYYAPTQQNIPRTVTTSICWPYLPTITPRSTSDGTSAASHGPSCRKVTTTTQMVIADGDSR